MTDTDLSLVETPEDEEPDYAREEYAESSIPYRDRLDDQVLRRLRAYRECVELVDRGVTKAEDGALDQVSGLYKIWANNLWGAEGFRSLEAWLEDFIV